MPIDSCRKYILSAVALILTALFLFDGSANAAEPTDASDFEDSGFLWLVNAENTLPPSYMPQNLTAYNRVRIHPAARDAWVLLLEAMQADGIYGLHLHSAFRDYERQEYLFNQKVRRYRSQGHSREDAEALAVFVVQHPGASEHQTGLALDVSTTGQLNQSFGETRSGEWLCENAHRFGFIIRYPKTKTHITHIIYEPWHLRYVGLPHAPILYEHDLTLEEYADFLSVHAPYLYLHESGERYLIQYTAGLPDPMPGDVIDISGTRFADNIYFVTASRIRDPLYGSYETAGKKNCLQ
ncbi:MAG: M15 family metallopeptidase [Defluviitaleaceae bacterium]|nr:M15 family metallopeptidase [Defluviitaleaceae bacterium]